MQIDYTAISRISYPKRTFLLAAAAGSIAVALAAIAGWQFFESSSLVSSRFTCLIGAGVFAFATLVIFKIALIRKKRFEDECAFLTDLTSKKNLSLDLTFYGHLKKYPLPLIQNLLKIYPEAIIKIWKLENACRSDPFSYFMELLEPDSLQAAFDELAKYLMSEGQNAYHMKEFATWFLTTLGKRKGETNMLWGKKIAFAIAGYSANERTDLLKNFLNRLLVTSNGAFLPEAKRQLIQEFKAKSQVFVEIIDSLDGSSSLILEKNSLLKEESV